MIVTLLTKRHSRSPCTSSVRSHDRGDSRRRLSTENFSFAGQVPSLVFYFAPPSVHTPIPSLKTIVVPYCSDIFARRSMIFLAMAGSARRGVP